MKSLFLILAAAFLHAQTSTPVEPALAEIAATHQFLQSAISPNGSRVAYVEAIPGGKSAIFLAPRTRVSAGDGKTFYDEHAVAWSPDGKQIAFLSDREK